MKNGFVIGIVLQIYVYIEFSYITKYFFGTCDLVLMRFECILISRLYKGIHTLWSCMVWRAMVTPGSDSLCFFFLMPLHINFPDQMHMWQQFSRLCNGRLAMWLPSWQVGSSMLKCPFKNNQRTHVRFLFFQPWCDYNSSQPLKMKKDVHRESNSVDLKCRSNGKSRKKNIRKPTKPAITMTRHFWW